MTNELKIGALYNMASGFQPDGSLKPNNKPNIRLVMYLGEASPAEIEQYWKATFFAVNPNVDCSEAIKKMCAIRHVKLLEEDKVWLSNNSSDRFKELIID